MNSSNSPSSYDEIHLQWWVGMLIRGRWIILACVVAAMVTAALVRFLVLAPSYQTSAVLVLPPVDSESGIGMSPSVQLQFAASDAVMQDVRQTLAVPSSIPELRKRYDFQLDDRDRILAVTVSDADPGHALRLAEVWTEAYARQLQADIQRQFTLREDIAAQKASALLHQRNEVLQEKGEFEAADTSSVLKAQLDRLESDLSKDRIRVRNVHQKYIPRDTRKLAAWQVQLDQLLQTAELVDASPADGAAAIAAHACAVHRRLGYENQVLEVQFFMSEMEQEPRSSQGQLRTLVWESILDSDIKPAFCQASLSPVLEQASLSPVPATDDDTSRGIQLSATDSFSHRIQLEVYWPEEASGETRIPILPGERERLGREMAIRQQKLDQLRQLIALADTMAKTEEDIVNWRIEAEYLTGTFPAALRDIEELKRNIRDAQNMWDQLEQQSASLEHEYSTAVLALRALRGIEPDLTALGTPMITIRPGLPAPHSPVRDVRNIGLAGFLGMVLGIAIVAFLEFFRRPPAAIASGQTVREHEET